MFGEVGEYVPVRDRAVAVGSSGAGRRLPGPRRARRFGRPARPGRIDRTPRRTAVVPCSGLRCSPGDGAASVGHGPPGGRPQVLGLRPPRSAGAPGLLNPPHDVASSYVVRDPPGLSRYPRPWRSLVRAGLPVMRPPTPDHGPGSPAFEGRSAHAARPSRSRPEARGVAGRCGEDRGHGSRTGVLGAVHADAVRGDGPDDRARRADPTGCGTAARPGRWRVHRGRRAETGRRGPDRRRSRHLPFDGIRGQAAVGGSPGRR